MSPKEFNQMIEKCSEDVSALLTSMKGLILLAERYSNSAQTNFQLTLISKCISEVEAILQNTKNKLS